ncbi:hypothetical protein AB0E66_27015 [Streptomyces sp. NPDC033753]|uniref:hypothetical protein n=1 Tax=Streptomyces sp. NPDC033753 TaxID=3155128 RepID=UPI0033DCD923
MARQLARGMGSFFKDCDCAKPTRCPHPYSIRFRDALGKQREESGCGTHNVVAQDMNRVREQIHSNTLKPAKLKHRKAGEFREVSLPRSAREAIERYEAKHGTTKDGFLLRGPGGYFTEGMERRRAKRLFADLPPEEGVGMYGFRQWSCAGSPPGDRRPRSGGGSDPAAA